jgi:PII-like signaling protein
MPFVSGLSLRILTREGARSGHRSVVDAIIEEVRHDGLAGITVTRGFEGYSAHGGMRTTNWADLADDLPLTIEIVDQAERIQAVLPRLTSLVVDGVLTVTDVQLFIPDART